MILPLLNPYFFSYCILQEAITVRENFSFHHLLPRKEILALMAAEPNPLLTSVEVRFPALSLQQFVHTYHRAQLSCHVARESGKQKVLIKKSHEDKKR